MSKLLYFLDEAILFYNFRTPKKGDPERDEILYVRDQLLNCRADLKFRGRSPETVYSAASWLMPFAMDLHCEGKHILAKEVDALVARLQGFPPPENWCPFDYRD